MKVMFRPQRGSLDEAMSEVESMDMSSIRSLLVNRFGAGEIEVKPYCYDERIGWDTFVVLHNGRAVGFTNGEPK